MIEAIYARQSLDKKDSLSIEAQIELCRRQANEGSKVCRDKGYSGKNTNRPAFEELLAQVQQGNIRKIYVYRLDRFSRSLADFSRVWQLLEQLMDHGIAVVLVSLNLSDSLSMADRLLVIGKEGIQEVLRKDFPTLAEEVPWMSLV